ncbi:MAG: nuclear transport factor 2 family protein, partial [Caulobacteraceae bacterium]|nr:nuclear transport factor 2 family protein [Caulobacteraceae bacterium]
MPTDETQRLRAAADLAEIQQLPVRYAQAIDSRDLEALSKLWTPDVWMGKAFGAGPEAVIRYFEPILRKFYRSIHMIVGHKIDLIDESNARGQVYCRAEHESGADWVVQAIIYADEYRRVDGRWLFVKRKHHHWYSSPIDQTPTPPSFENWAALGGPLPDLPHVWPSWKPYWDNAPEARAATSGAPDAPSGEPARRALRTADKLEIHEMAALYGIAIDDRDWLTLGRVFTDDVLFVIEPFRGNPEVRIQGLDALRNYMDKAIHPLAHHVTNVFVDGGPDDATMRSKVIGALPKGMAGTADYRDKLRLTPNGWR